MTVAHNDHRTCLYAVEHPHGYHKIGKANSPETRVSGIQTGCPYDLELWLVAEYSTAADLGADWVSFEDAVQEALGDHHVRGEWYEVTRRDVLDAVGRLADTGDHLVFDVQEFDDYIEKKKARRELRSSLIDDPEFWAARGGF